MQSLWIGFKCNRTPRPTPNPTGQHFQHYKGLLTITYVKISTRQKRVGIYTMQREAEDTCIVQKKDPACVQTIASVVSELNNLAY